MFKAVLAVSYGHTEIILIMSAPLTWQLREKTLLILKMLEVEVDHVFGSGRIKKCFANIVSSIAIYFCLKIVHVTLERIPNKLFFLLIFL